MLAVPFVVTFSLQRFKGHPCYFIDPAGRAIVG